MTDTTERAELVAERAELVAKNEAATSWGAAVGARHERIVEIDRQLRRLASQDQKPVAWQILGLDWKWIDAPSKAAADGCVKDGTALNVRPAPQKPPPAAGWNDATEAAIDRIEGAISDLQAELAITEGHDNVSKWKIEIAVPDLQAVTKALRTTPGATKSDDAGGELPPLTYDFTRVFPDGRVDDATYGKLETALDKIETPIKDATGKWLSLHERIAALSHQPAPVAAIDPRWRTELDEIVSHLGAAITQSVASDDQIIMDHVKAAHEIAKVVRRQA